MGDLFVRLRGKSKNDLSRKLEELSELADGYIDPYGKKYRKKSMELDPVTKEWTIGVRVDKVARTVRAVTSWLERNGAE